jgi:plasmid stabilization system protein ParE
VAFAIAWAEVAVEDLNEVADFIARDSRYYASAMVREARLAAQSLRRFPYRGRVVPESGDSQVRELFIRDYRLIYRVLDDKVVVLAFIHGARDLAARWERRGGPDDAIGGKAPKDLSAAHDRYLYGEDA